MWRERKSLNKSYCILLLCHTITTDISTRNIFTQKEMIFMWSFYSTCCVCGRWKVINVELYLFYFVKESELWGSAFAFLNHCLSSDPTAERKPSNALNGGASLPGPASGPPSLAYKESRPCFHSYLVMYHFTHLKQISASSQVNQHSGNWCWVRFRQENFLWLVRTTFLVAQGKYMWEANSRAMSWSETEAESLPLCLV